MEEGQRENEPAEDNDRPEVTGRRRRDVGAKQPARYGGPEAECQLEGPAPFRDEIVAWVISPRVVGVVAAPRARRVEHRFPRDVELGSARTPRELFDRVTVTVSRHEVHRSIGSARSKHFVDQADALEEFGPV